MHYLLVALIEPDQKDRVRDRLSELMAPFDEDLEVEPYLDEDGEETTWNPDGYWDWYRPGGRWDGWAIDDERRGFNFTGEFETLERNMTTTDSLLEREKVPYSLLTPDGWDDRSDDPAQGDAWKGTCLKAYRDRPGWIAVGVDYHG